MRNLIHGLLIVTLALLATSCMGIDNFDGPDAWFSGKIIDATTGGNVLADQTECHIRIWEKSYSLTPAPQDIPLKMDGTFNNNKLFRGTYDVVPEGAWWPADTVRVGIGNHATYDFEVTPYLKIKDFKAEFDGDSIVISGRLFAPVTAGLPQVNEVRPFLSLNQYCGAANHIDYYYTDNLCLSLRKMWKDLGDMDTGEGKDVYTFKVKPKAGYIYFVRMGANVNDNFKKYNYSEIVKIEIPQ